MKAKSESEVTQSYPSPSDPMDCSLPGSFLHGIFQARVLEWGAIAFLRFKSFMHLKIQLLFFLLLLLLAVLGACRISVPQSGIKPQDIAVKA